MNAIATITRDAPVPLQKIRTVAELVNSPEARARLADVAVSTVRPDRMLRILASATRQNPKLAEVPALDLLGAVMTCASMGLEPNTPMGHAYLIPFAKRGQRNGQWVDVGVEVQLVIGYKGLVDLVRRSGQVLSIHADVVYEGDLWSYSYGSGQHLRHTPMGQSETPIAAYCYVALKDGGEAFDVLPWSRIEKLRDATQAMKTWVRGGSKPASAPPWVTHPHEMAAKTMIRRLSKLLPMTLELARAVTVDDARLNYGSVALSSSRDDAMLAIESQSEDAMVSDVAEEASATEVVPVRGAAKPRKAAPVEAVPVATPAPAVSAPDRLVDEIAGALLDANNLGDVETIEAMYADAIESSPDRAGCLDAIASVRRRFAPPHDPETGEVHDELPFDAPGGA